MSRTAPVGMALYVRHITRSKHGTPKAFAAHHRDHGMKWVAIGGPWHDERGRRFINKPDVSKRYLDACADAGLDAYVWGYPWQGREEQFAEDMKACAGDHDRSLLDPELGANPSRSRRAAPMRRANQHAADLVRHCRERFRVVGLSTYGSGVRIGWFPMKAFLEAGVDFAGGQTYIEDKRIDPSIEDYVKAIAKYAPGTPLVPNYGVYNFVRKGGKRRAIRKTPEQLIAHLSEFIDEGEPVEAMIGWAENFAGKVQWKTLARFAEWMERGACVLPPAT